MSERKVGLLATAEPCDHAHFNKGGEALYINVDIKIFSHSKKDMCVVFM
jgi:hypothetical protein